MSAPRTVPPAPNPGVVPLPTPRDPTKKDYSEGSMYEDLSAEDVEAWHRRYAEFKRWRQEIPNKGLRDYAAGVGTGSSMSLGRGVGVGSADWEWTEPSECGTVPTTIVERAPGDRSGTSGLGKGRLGPQAEPPAPAPPPSRSNRSKVPQQQARVSTQSHSTTQPSKPSSKATVPSRLPLKQKTSIPQILANNESQPLKVPTIEVQPPSSKTPNQQLPTRQASTVRPPPTPVLAQPAASQTTIKPAKPSSQLKSTSRPPSTRGSPLPGELVVPSPTPSARYAEREAYIHSALELPLDMLTETADGAGKAASSSQLTTSRLGSLLGKSRGNSKGGGASQRSSSSTTLPSVKSERIERYPDAKLDSVQEGKLVRSKTTSAVPMQTRPSEKTTQSHREHHYETSDHLPVPGTQPGRSRTPTEFTVTRAAQHPLPPSTSGQSRAPTVLPANSTQTGQPSAASQSTRQPTYHVPTDATVVRAAQQPLPPSEATVIRATREPLPLSVPTTTPSHAETIKVPVSVKTAMASSGVATPAPTTAATVSRAAQVPLPESAVTTRTSTRKSVPSATPRYDGTAANQAHLSPRQIPLPLTAISATSTAVPPSPPAPTHRQQMPLPRPALTPQSSFDGLSRTLSRRTRDPSLADLTARFEPEMYPLPPSGATIFSSPEHSTPQPAPRTKTAEPEVAFTTVEYIPQSEARAIGTSLAPSTPAHPAQPSAKSRSTKSQVPATPGVRAVDVPLPPSTAGPVWVDSPQRTLPSAPAPSLASPPVAPAPPAPSPAHGPPPLPSKSATSEQRSSHHTQTSDREDSQPHPQSPPGHPHIHFSPGQVSESLRSEDDHVSFEVPSGSRGRLRVTLKWLRSERGTPRGGRLEVVDEHGDEPPPPVPPKPSSLISRVVGRSAKGRSEPSRPAKMSSGTTSGDRNSQQRHPLSIDERPELDAPSPKRDNPKSPSSQDRFPPGQQAQQQHHPSGPAPYYNNPYYSGATLPAYRAQMPQVYNLLSPPFGYPQPPPQMGWGAYRLVPQGQMEDPGSPTRESVDPPSDHEEREPARPMGRPYPNPMMGMMSGYPQPNPNQAWYGQGQGRPSIWQKMFRRPSQDPRPGTGVDDNGTIKNWRNGVSPGRAPTAFQQQGAPTMTPQRPTMAPTVYPGMAAGESPAGPSGPGTTLYDARYGYPPGMANDRGRQGRDRSPSVWEKLMYRRQVDEAVYASPRRRGKNLPNPTPMPPRSRAGFTSKGRGLFSPRAGRDMAPRAQGREIDTRREGRERRSAQREEKLERRRQRAARRDERERAIRQGQGQGQNGYRPNGMGLMGAAQGPGLRRDVFGRVESRDRPVDLGGLRGGRSRTMVGDWVGALGVRRNAGKFPDSQGPLNDYRPTQWKDRLKLNRSTARAPRTFQPGPGGTNVATLAQGQAEARSRGAGAGIFSSTRTAGQGGQKLRRGDSRRVNGLGLNLAGRMTAPAQPQQVQRQGQDQMRTGAGTGSGVRGVMGRFGLGNTAGARRTR